MKPVMLILLPALLVIASASSAAGDQLVVTDWAGIVRAAAPAQPGTESTLHLVPEASANFAPGTMVELSDAAGRKEIREASLAKLVFPNISPGIWKFCSSDPAYVIQDVRLLTEEDSSRFATRGLAAGGLAAALVGGVAVLGSSASGDGSSTALAGNPAGQFPLEEPASPPAQAASASFTDDDRVLCATDEEPPPLSPFF